MGGEAAAHGESKIDGWKKEDGICPWFLCDFCRQLLSPSPSLGEKQELVHAYEVFYAR